MLQAVYTQAARVALARELGTTNLPTLDAYEVAYAHFPFPVKVELGRPDRDESFLQMATGFFGPNAASGDPLRASKHDIDVNGRWACVGLPVFLFKTVEDEMLFRLLVA